MTNQTTHTEMTIELCQKNIEKYLIQKERLQKEISELLIHIEVIDGCIYRENVIIDTIEEANEIWCDCDLTNYYQLLSAEQNNNN